MNKNNLPFQVLILPYKIVMKVILMLPSVIIQPPIRLHFRVLKAGTYGQSFGNKGSLVTHVHACVFTTTYDSNKTHVCMRGSPVICIISMWPTHKNPLCACARRGLSIISVWRSHVFPQCTGARQPLKAGRAIFALSVPNSERQPLSLSPFLPFSLSLSVHCFPQACVYFLPLINS